jgi:gamma-glutamyl hydrolase
MKEKVLSLLLLFIIAVTALPKQSPIIGIFTQSDSSDEPVNSVNKQVKSASNYTYIAASYVKYIQMSGAQVVPIFAYSDKSYFDNLLPKLNGVLFPGNYLLIQVEMWISTSKPFGHKTQNTS